MPSSRLPLAVAGLVVTLATFFPAASAQTDLDAFMKAVVARSDDNWKKLQQYILDERDELAIKGPSGVRLWADQKDYTWFLREGFFVKSPVKANGATVGEADRRKFEDAYLRAMQRRDARGRLAGPENAPPDSTGVGAVARPDNNDSETDAPTSVDGLIRQTRQPQFVSSSYFLRFKFDEGRYVLAGREKFEGRDVLRVEYYPTKLYGSNNGGRRGRRGERSEPRPQSEKQKREQAELQKVMNKVAIVTLWIEPSSHQIVKYTFDNIDLDFLPAAWLIQVDTIKASMTMGQPFPEVWLPKDIDLEAAFTLAIGKFEFKQTVAYRDYREANVTSKIIIPGAR
jgi:hypothetical protein